ncbi:hypothetical protein ABH11_02196 [Serratia marcescens]|nr:hypothetical protein ABH11_02196 [Serratia marcescens]
MTHLKCWASNNPWAALFYACAIFWVAVAAAVALAVLL